MAIGKKLSNWLTRDNYINLTWIFFGIIFYFVFLYQLSSMNLIDFDESRVAKSSYEMSQSGDLIVVKYGGNPDLWSTKPALFHWVQATFIKIMGLSEMSVRLPSAICGIVLCVLIFRFCKRRLHNPLLGILAMLVFVTAPATVYFDHSFRTGDYDALMTLFTFVSAINLFLYIQENNNRNLYYFFVFLGLAILTKGVAALFFAPGYFLYILIRKKLLVVLKNKHFYFGAGGMLLIAGSYFLLRELNNPGYLKALNDMEIMGRYTNTGSFSIYEEADFWVNFFQLINVRFPVFYLLIPCGFFIGIFSKREVIKQFSLFSVTICLCLYFVISYSSSTNFWYDLPMYPFVAIMVALVLVVIHDLISDIIKEKTDFNPRAVFISLCFILFCIPFAKTMQEVHAPFPTKGMYWSNFNVLQNYFEFGKVKNGYMLAIEKDKNPSQSQLFYIDKLYEDRGIKIPHRFDYDFKPGEMLITLTPGIQDYIATYYNCVMVESYYEIKVFRIISKK